MDKKSEHELEKALQELSNDLKSIESYIAGEYTKIIKNNSGKIDVNNKDFKTAQESLFSADPNILNSKEAINKRGGKVAVLSFTATEQGINERIDQLIEKGYSENDFIDIKTNVATAKEQLNKSLVTNEGVRALVAKKIIKDLIVDQTAFFAKSSDTSNVNFITPDKKDLLIQDIFHDVDTKDITNITSLLNPSDKFKNNIKTAICEKLGYKAQPDHALYTLDESKVIPNNLQNLANEITGICVKESKNVSIKEKLPNTFKTIKNFLSNLTSDKNKKNFKKTSGLPEHSQAAIDITEKKDIEFKPSPPSTPHPDQLAQDAELVKIRAGLSEDNTKPKRKHKNHSSGRSSSATASEISESKEFQTATESLRENKRKHRKSRSGISSRSRKKGSSSSRRKGSSSSRRMP